MRSALNERVECVEVEEHIVHLVDSPAGGHGDIGRGSRIWIPLDGADKHTFWDDGIRWVLYLLRSMKS